MPKVGGMARDSANLFQHENEAAKFGTMVTTNIIGSFKIRE